MNTNFTLTFHLKQHMPIIHFQYGQEGATLRATELKPKLDKFIINNINKNNKIPRHWQNNAEQTSLNYKVKITAQGSHNSYIFATLLNDRQRALIREKGPIPVAPSPYFAGNEHIKNHKIDTDQIIKGSLCTGNITVTFFCLIPDLLQEINNCFAGFLLHHNFGTRQSKGFGSFTLAQLNPQQLRDNLKKYASDGVVFESIATYSGVEDVLRFIAKSYQIIKSGTGKKNAKGVRQTPSLLQKHYLNLKINGNPIVWEAASIKECLYHKSANIEQADGLPQIEAFDEERYIRALLGLAEEYSYMQESIPIDKVKITDHEGKIERFQSPITFKIINNKVYILCHKIPDLLYDRTFKFSAKERVPLLIKTPPKTTQLNLPKFLEHNLDKRDWRKL